MRSIQLIQQGICYMEERLLEGVTYERAARSVSLSPFQFHRTFTALTGLTPGEYIRNRRLSLAGQELQTGNISVLEAALKYGYETPESFSKAFSRFHGVTPRQAKGKGAQLHLFNPLVIKLTVEGGSVMDYRLETTGAQRYLAWVRDLPNDLGEEGNDGYIRGFWAECREKGRIGALLALLPEGMRDLCGLCSPAETGQSRFRYGIGARLPGDGPVPGQAELLDRGCVIVETEPRDYAVFQCCGAEAGCVRETWRKFYREFIPQTGYAQTEDTDLEIYYEHGAPGVFCEIWVPVVRE